LQLELICHPERTQGIPYFAAAGIASVLRIAQNEQFN
jgi:hypothetical protein